MGEPIVCPVGWMRDRLPANAISTEERPAPMDKELLVWVSDPSVCIYYSPTVARLSSDGTWWAGLPGRWVDLKADRWTVTHWREIAPKAQETP